jgi:hypothetical protein
LIRSFVQGGSKRIYWCLGTIWWSYEDGGGRNLNASFRISCNVVCTTQALFSVHELDCKVSRDMFARYVVVVEKENLSDVVDRAVYIKGKSEWNATAQ